MTTIRHCENSQQNDGGPMTALHNVADNQRLRAAATQALRILERTSLAPITAALLRAALEAREGQASQTHRTVGFGRGVPLKEEARCPT